MIDRALGHRDTRPNKGCDSGIVSAGGGERVGASDGSVPGRDRARARNDGVVGSSAPSKRRTECDQGNAIRNSGAIGFRTRSTLDESEQTREKTRLAVARAKEGDRDALRYLYVSYSHNVYGYVRSIVRDEHEAEDVTQHVFAKLMTAIVKYDDRGIPFFAWLLRFARNLAIDHLRANRLTPTETVLDPEILQLGDRSRSR